MKISKKNFIFIVSTLFLIFSGYFAIVAAQAPDDIDDSGIIYPIKELGSCKDKSDCKNFCDKPDNIVSCVNFAEKKNLMSERDVQKARAFAAAKTGPGGCKGKEECEAYCDKPDNINVCLDFAEKNNLMTQDEIKEAKQIASVLKEGVILPGGCKTKSECESYCDDPLNMNECLAFAEKAGLMPPKELEEAKKAARAFASGIKSPGNCKGKKECDAYCGEPSHMEECLSFAEAAGFIPKEEVEQARKMIPLMAQGKMPGGCKGKEECEAYCQNENNLNECANFAIEAGLMKPEEAEMFKKTGGKGPGGCRGKEECESFCNNPDNQEICFGFAKEHNLIPPEEIERMKEGVTKIKETFQSAPPEIAECLKSTVGAEILEKINAGTLAPSQQLGEQMRSCFEKFMPPRPEGFQEGVMPPEDQMPRRFPPSEPINFMGPGGCKTPEECQSYCSEPGRQEECGQFKAPSSNNVMPSTGILPPEGMMPPEGFIPPDYHPEGVIPPEAYLKQPPEGESGGYQQYQNQYQQQYEGQYQQQYEQMAPPSDMQQMIPPTEYQTPAPDSYQAPSSSIFNYSVAQIIGFLLRLIAGNL